MRRPVDGAAELSVASVDHALAAADVDRVDLAEEAQRLVDAQLAGSRHERADVLGQAAAAEAEAGVEEAPADAGVVADRVGELRDVGAGRLAQLGHRVDERDLGGEERVGGDLDQLGGRVVGDDPGRALRHAVSHRPRRASSAARCAGLAVRHAVDQAVGVQRVLDREALAEELRVPHQRRVGLGSRELLGQPLGGADRHGGLADHEIAVGQVGQQRLVTAAFT